MIAFTLGNILLHYGFGKLVQLRFRGELVRVGFFGTDIPLPQAALRRLATGHDSARSNISHGQQGTGNWDDEMQCNSSAANCDRMNLDGG